MSAIKSAVGRSYLELAAWGHFLRNMTVKGQREKQLWDNSSLTEAGEGFRSKKKSTWEGKMGRTEGSHGTIIMVGCDYHIKSV